VVLNGYGVSDETQLMSGVIGLERNDATTFCAQGLAGESSGIPIAKRAPCPSPGKTVVVEFCSVPATYIAHCGAVLPSKLLAMTRVGILLTVIWRTDADAAGTFQTAQSSDIKGKPGASDRTVVG
jgi:hypothetical protein